MQQPTPRVWLQSWRLLTGPTILLAVACGSEERAPDTSMAGTSSLAGVGGAAPAGGAGAGQSGHGGMTSTGGTGASSTAGASATMSGGAPAMTSGGAGASSAGETSSSGGSGAGASNGGATAGGRGGRGGMAGNASSAAGSSAGGASGSFAGGSAGASDITPPPGYQLVWHDEFDVDGAPDPKNWKFENGFVRNEEDQWYQADNATVEGGLLVIEGRKEQVENPNYAGGGDWKTSREYAEYTSSSLHTSGLQSFKYGRFEMRGRIPTSAGMWPAWWTLGVSGEWPSNGEVDIMEYYGGNVLANVACGTSTQWQAKWDSTTRSLSSLGAGWSSEFHVWRMEWDDQSIELFLDDESLNTTALSSMLNADGTSPFKQNAYMLVNLALGGNNGGSLAGTTFPVRYEVDYIRVFQKQ